MNGTSFRMEDGWKPSQDYTSPLPVESETLYAEDTHDESPALTEEEAARFAEIEAMTPLC